MKTPASLVLHFCPNLLVLLRIVYNIPFLTLFCLGVDLIKNMFWILLKPEISNSQSFLKVSLKI